MQGGPVTFIANDANNTLTLIGTAQQIQLAEDMLYDLDIKPPQVAIQVSVVQLDENRTKGLNVGVNQTPGQLSIQGPNGGLNYNGVATTLFWDSTGNLIKSAGSSSLLSALGLQGTYTTTKSKLLANPTLLAVSGSSSSMNVQTDTLIGSQTTTTGNPPITTTSPIIKSVGISLTITPQVSNDGTVILNLAPTISNTNGTQTVGTGSSATTVGLTSTNTLTIAQARVKDGETLILAGLIREDYSSNSSKIPFLSDIPGVGALFQPSSNNSNTRKEIVVMVTPHIVKEDGVPYFRKDWQNNISYTEGSQVAHAYRSQAVPNQVIPASDTTVTVSGNAVQTLEQRQSDPNLNTGSAPTRTMNLPLRTFSEVLK